MNSPRVNGNSTDRASKLVRDAAGDITWNGGFMANRMACQFSDVIAGIVSRAGTTTLGETNCRPSQPVIVLYIHGTADDVVPYAGGRLSADLPGVSTNTPAATGALQVVQLWAGFNGSQDPVTDAV